MSLLWFLVGTCHWKTAIPPSLQHGWRLMQAASLQLPAQLASTSTEDRLFSWAQWVLTLPGEEPSESWSFLESLGSLDPPSRGRDASVRRWFHTDILPSLPGALASAFQVLALPGFLLPVAWEPWPKTAFLSHKLGTAFANGQLGSVFSMVMVSYFLPPIAW